MGDERLIAWCACACFLVWVCGCSCLLDDCGYGGILYLKVQFVEMHVNVDFVGWTVCKCLLSCLYSAVILTRVREQQ